MSCSSADGTSRSRRGSHLVQEKVESGFSLIKVTVRLTSKGKPEAGKASSVVHRARRTPLEEISALGSNQKSRIYCRSTASQHD